jgi:uncharacterized protein YggU (UPF0235/DUF167 family)
LSRCGGDREARIRVRVQPGASREEIAGERAGAFVVRLTAPPVEGRANEALCKLIAKRVGAANGRATVGRGARTRERLFGSRASGRRKCAGPSWSR